jgi:hypothetical protein
MLFIVALIFPPLTLAATRFGEVAFDALRFGDIAKPLALVLESILYISKNDF